MKKIYRLINYLFWPTITGLLLAILIFTFFPQWIDDQQQLAKIDDTTHFIKSIVYARNPKIIDLEK